MQTLKRCAYALASYDSNYAHDLYDEKKARLERFCRNVMQRHKEMRFGNKTVAVSAAYSKEKNITACIYKGKLFIGFQDKKTGLISFDDNSNEFVKMGEQTLEQLEIRMYNAMNALEKDKPFLMNKQLTPHWGRLYPLMDKIMEYENSFKEFPTVKQKVLENSGIKDVQINDLIRKMEPNLHPLIEEALEEMYGMDIGKLGKQDEFSAMSNIEEEQAEKRYYTDVGSVGHTDRKLFETSLADRLKEAENEYNERRSAREEQKKNKSHDKDMEWQPPGNA